MSEIEATIKNADEMLETARCGFADLIANDKSRRIVGLRNLIVFGRTVTFVLQNLRSKMVEGEFDVWYIPKQEEMKKDVVMKHFVTLRNELEKQGNLPVSTSVHITEFSFQILINTKNHLEPLAFLSVTSSVEVGLKLNCQMEAKKNIM